MFNGRLAGVDRAAGGHRDAAMELNDPDVEVVQDPFEADWPELLLGSLKRYLDLPSDRGRKVLGGSVTLHESFAISGDPFYHWHAIRPRDGCARVSCINAFLVEDCGNVTFSVLIGQEQKGIDPAPFGSELTRGLFRWASSNPTLARTGPFSKAEWSYSPAHDGCIRYWEADSIGDNKTEGLVAQVAAEQIRPHKIRAQLNVAAGL